MAVSDARSINSSLQRIKETIKVGVLQVEATQSTVHADGEAITSSLHEHKYVLKSALDSTNTRLHKIQNAERREMYMLLFSFLFFFTTVAFIIFKRVGILQLLWSFLTC